jgi:hypothetical protein
VTVADVARRGLKAADAGAWAYALGQGGGGAAAQAALASQDIPTPYDNPAGDMWRKGLETAAPYVGPVVAGASGNDTIGKVAGAAIEPQMRDSARAGQAVLGMVAQPLNVVPLAEVGEAGRLAEGARAVGLLDRGAVAARPLGLVEEAASLRSALEGARGSAELEDRLARVLEVTRKLRAGETLSPEESALHAEVQAKYEAPRPTPTGAQAEGLKEARARYDYHVEQAANATSRGARENAQALADDYAKEIVRLEGEAVPSPEGFDAHHSRFQPRTGEGQFDGPPQPLWKRAASNARAVVQLPKAKAGFDLSATGRQGLAQALAHPSYLKEAFARQVRAFASEDAAKEFAQSIRNRPDFEQMNEAGLFLSSTGPEAEEAFASKLAQRIPGVRASDRAYSTALDSIRTQAWDNYTHAPRASAR